MIDPLLENPPAHTLRSRLQDAYYYALYYTLRHAPIDLVSDIGSFMVRRNVPRHRPWIIEGARRNLSRFWPDATEVEVEAGIQRFLDNVGRIMAEFAVLPRLHKAGRIQVTAEGERKIATLGEAPTVAIIVHTGNWEVCAAAIHARGVSVAAFAIPPETWAQRVIATKVRKELGHRMLMPDWRGLLDARHQLVDGGTVGFFCDETREGVVMAPFFGRPPHRNGNLAIAARLIRQTNARILVVNCRRLEKSRFRIDATEFFELPATKLRGEELLLEDVAYLNGVIEPIIVANVDQWYFLDNPTEPPAATSD